MLGTRMHACARARTTPNKLYETKKKGVTQTAEPTAPKNQLSHPTPFLRNHAIPQNQGHIVCQREVGTQKHNLYVNLHSACQLRQGRLHFQSGKKHKRGRSTGGSWFRVCMHDTSKTNAVPKEEIAKMYKLTPQKYMFTVGSSLYAR
jgi:hypothetical protein